MQGKTSAIVAPTGDKSKLLMRYYIEHLGDHPVFERQLEKDTKMERLRQEGSKARIVLRNGGGIFAVSAQQSSGKSIESAMGMGAEITIVDEAGLIDDDTESTIFRMIAGKGPKGFYCKIGNPFYSQAPYTHFKASWNNPKYLRIFINDVIAVKEGRYSQDFLDESATKPLYDQLYKCKFPPEDEIDIDGYRQLVIAEELHYNNDQLDRIMKEWQVILDLKEELKQPSVSYFRIDEIKKLIRSSPSLKLGVDIGGGGDKSTFILRLHKLACVADTLHTKDTMANVTKVIELKERFGLSDDDISIDDLGVGRGVSDRLIELGHEINAVGFGESPRDKETFDNLKAELFWKTGAWVKDGGAFDVNDNWVQLTWMKWKQASGERKIIFEKKENLKKRTKKSPDYADGLALTFYEPKFIGFA